MEIENILKVSFNESIILTQFPMMKIIENDIEFDNLILMINEIEEKRGLGFYTQGSLYRIRLYG